MWVVRETDSFTLLVAPVALQIRGLGSTDRNMMLVSRAQPAQPGVHGLPTVYLNYYHRGARSTYNNDYGDLSVRLCRHHGCLGAWLTPYL
jgi:hypothetical protein